MCRPHFCEVSSSWCRTCSLAVAGLRKRDAEPGKRVGDSKPTIYIGIPASAGTLVPGVEALSTIEQALISTSSRVVAHEHTLIRIALRPRQTVPPHQQTPS